MSSIYGCGVNVQNSPSPSNSPSTGANPSSTSSPTPSASPIRNANNTYPPIPGTSQIGSGYNILSSTQNYVLLIGTPTTGKIFKDFTYYGNHTYEINGDLYSIPDQVDISRAQSFGVKTFVYQSISDYLNQESKNLGLTLDGKIKHIPVGVSTYLQHINDEMVAKQSVFAIATENIPLYNLNLYPNLPLEDSFINAVKNINNNQSCEEFLNNYGTHIQIDLELGGQFAMIGVLHSSETGYYSNMNIGVSMHIAMISGSFGGSISPYSGINKNQPPAYTQLSKYKYGGDTSISSNYEGWYDAWVSSVPKNPAAVGRQLMSIIPLMKSISMDAGTMYENFVLDQLNSLQNNTVEGANLPPVLDYYKNVVPPAGGLHYITYYNDDDDDCQVRYWDVQSSSGLSQSLMRSHKPLPISWKFNKVFGTTPEGSDVVQEETSSSKLQATTIESANYHCGNYPCIPGLDTMGIGFDIVTGETRLPAVEWTFNSLNTWKSPDTGILYSYPDQILLDKTSTSSAAQSIFTSFAEYCMNSTDVSSSGWNGYFFQFGTEQQSVMHAFDASQSIIGLAEESYISHSLNLQRSIPSSAFNYSVSLLPNDYDQDAYFQFLLNWGTHYSNYASYGGKAKLFSYIDQDYYTTYSYSEMQNTLGIQFDGWKAGIGWGSSSSTGTYSFSEDSFQWVSFYGGDATLALTNQWSDWIKSTQYAPAQVYKQLLPIQNLVSNPTIAQNIALAVSDYYNQNQVSLPPPIYLEMILDTETSISSGLVVSYYETACTFTHGFDWDESEKFATSAMYRNYYFSAPSGYYAPTIISTSCESSKAPFCEAPSYISSIDRHFPIGCKGQPCYGSLGGDITCCKLALAL